MVRPAFPTASALLVASLAMLLPGCGPDALAPSDPAPAISFVIIAGNGQSGVAGTELPAALAIRALDNAGNPIADLTVSYRVISGGGSMFAGVATTNNNGAARDYWTLGTSTAEVQTVEVRAVKPNGTKQVFGTFTATALAGPPAQVALHAGNGQTAAGGTAVAIAPAVRVTDQYGNPVPGAAVTFAIGAGGGSATGAAATTDAGGIASVGSWTLGAPGPNSLTATSAGGAVSGNPITFTATATAPAGWQTLASLPTPRGGLSIGVINGVVYAVGGHDLDGSMNAHYLGTLEAYDPVTNSWTTLASMLTPRFGAAVGVVNGKLYVVGGYTTGATQLASVEEYDPATNVWTLKAPMAGPRAGLAIGVIGGKLYAVGGNLNAPLATVEVYDPALDTWTTLASLPTARYGLSAGVVGGTLYAVGGIDYGVLGVVEAYDPVANSWTTRATMPTARAGHAVGVVNGNLYAVGGTNGTLLGTLEAYDPVANSWTPLTSMPTVRTSPAAGVVNGVLYVIGGFFGASQPLGTVEAIVP